MKSKKGKITIISIVIAIILTTFIISGTYAKYVSEIDLIDEARVAKWNVDFGNNTENVDLFKDSYLCDENGENCYVQSLNSNKDKIIAPGTSGQYSFKIVVDSEARYKISLSVPEYRDDTEQLEFKLEDKNGIHECNKCIDPDSNEEFGGIECLAYMLEELYNSDAGYDLDKYSHYDKTYTIYWKWPFGDSDSIDDPKNKKDTDLGHQAIIEAKDPNDKEDPYYKQKKVKLSINITVEQDTNPKGLTPADEQ